MLFKCKSFGFMGHSSTPLIKLSRIPTCLWNSVSSSILTKFYLALSSFYYIFIFSTSMVSVKSLMITIILSSLSMLTKVFLILMTLGWSFFTFNMKGSDSTSVPTVSKASSSVRIDDDPKLIVSKECRLALSSNRFYICSATAYSVSSRFIWYKQRFCSIK